MWSPVFQASNGFLVCLLTEKTYARSWLEAFMMGQVISGSSYVFTDVVVDTDEVYADLCTINGEEVAVLAGSRS